MSQFGRPDGDVTNTGAGGGFASIDEASAVDGDFWWGHENTVDTLEVSLSNLIDPLASTGHTFRYRIAKIDIDGLGSPTESSTGNALTITASLVQGTTVIASDAAQTATGAWTTFTLTLTGAEADAITDYTDLRLRFVTSASGGSPANRRAGGVAWAELEIPDVPDVPGRQPGLTHRVVADAAVQRASAW